MYFTEERIKRILDELSKYIHTDSEQITAYKVKAGNYGEISVPERSDNGWGPFPADGRWGGKDKHFWFMTDVEIPARFEGKEVVYEVRTGREGQWDATNPQFLVYINGKLTQGLDVNHCEVILSQKAKAGDFYTIILNAYSGMKENLVELKTKISVIDRVTEKLYYNIKVPYDIAALLDKEDKRHIDILKYLNEAVNILDLRKPFSESYNASVIKANEFIEKEFYDLYCGCEDIIATCVGHTHIDVAWLWTLAQTREKAARSFSTVLNLMKQYPEYIFMSSQPQLYKYIKEDYPELYEEIKDRVKEGRWEPEGAMWLEADCNIASGEALVRQLLFGIRFFEKEFGVKNRILWLPDVFGYSAALPQILKKCGIDYFMTTKISWNEYNKIPYDSFMWKGMDGTEILTHFITTSDYKGNNWLASHTTTYNGNLIPNQIMGAWKRYQQKDLNNEVLVAFGYGDGGGGPTSEMLENARRMEKGIPGCPKVRIGNSLDYFKKLEMTVSNNKRLPKWVGELYLEYHRGTYTSMATNKKYNRKSEFLYQDAEMLSTLNDVAAGGGSYPQEKLNEGWETILLNQFHDILPGSSIKEVYEDSKEQYLEVLSKGSEIVKAALSNIASNIEIDSLSVVVFNQLGFNRSDVAELKLPEGFESVEVIDYSGRVVRSQVIGEGGDRRVIFFAENVPAKGYKAFRLKQASAANAVLVDDMNINNQLLSNKYFEIKFDENSNIVSLVDKLNNRELLKSGQKANVIQAFEDKPHRYDAWDINIYYQEKMWEVNDVESIEAVERGPVRAGLKVKKKFLDSQIEQIIYIYNDVPRIDFASVIDWKEKQILLKAAFPVDIHADKATFEIQYGNVERPTHWNTSWDLARFEVCAHKWADLSEDGYGVSLLNDCKYGYDIKDSVARLTLLKSAIEPNEDADREIHEFTYSLYPHAGSWKEGKTVQMAYTVNCPMYTYIEQPHEGKLPAEFSMVNVDKENVVIEVVKKAEDNDDVIVRVYECYNRRTAAEISFFKELKEVWECDLLENNSSKLQVDGKSFTFDIKPYEIKTFRIKV